MVGVSGLAFMVHGGLWSSDWGLGFRVSGFGFGVSGLEFVFLGLEFRVQSSVIRFYAKKCWQSVRHPKLHGNYPLPTPETLG